MQFFTVFAAAATLIAGSNALFIPRNIHVADFRLYGAEGCHDVNLGVWTVIDDDFKNGECKSLGDDETFSLSLTDINKGCTCKSSLSLLLNLTSPPLFSIISSQIRYDLKIIY
jgi:hypothetical protein